MPQCYRCARYRGSDLNGEHTCDAFSERIPGVIFAGDFDHSVPYLGDHGIGFKRIDAKPRRTREHCATRA